ncbi:hypothetical protein HGA88_06315 [Candidatus Roizmanbacteria bacterium]|nr:hypothetical protein [Candidatus Roizmanbacteria bacterium]
MPLFESPQEYLDYEECYYPAYIQELKDDLKKNLSTNKHNVYVVVPIHSSEPNLNKLLSQIGKLKIKNYNCGVVFYLNRGVGDPSFELLQNAIRRKFNNNLPLYIIEKTFDKKTTIGYIRKYVIDMLLLLTQGEPVIFLNLDADLEYIDPQFVTSCFKLLKEDPFILGYGEAAVDPKFRKFPILHSLLQVYSAVEHEINSSTLEIMPVRTLGQCMAFSSSLYTKIGGFAADIDLGEDLSFGLQIQDVFSKKNIRKLDGKILFSHRRAVNSYLHGAPIFSSWQNFSNPSNRRSLNQWEIEDISAQEEKYSEEYFFHDVELYFQYCVYERFPLYFSRYGQEHLSFLVAYDIFVKVLKELGYCFHVQQGIKYKDMQISLYRSL